MRRTFTILIALALVGSLAFAGFAGTAAASHSDEERTADQETTVSQQSTAEVNQYQSNYQTNVNTGDQTSIAASYKGSATASNDVVQTNVNEQIGVAESANFAAVSQNIDQE